MSIIKEDYGDGRIWLEPQDRICHEMSYIWYCRIGEAEAFRITRELFFMDGMVEVEWHKDSSSVRLKMTYPNHAREASERTFFP